jgi:hypothetical protein
MMLVTPVVQVVVVVLIRLRLVVQALPGKVMLVDKAEMLARIIRLAAVAALEPQETLHLLAAILEMEAMAFNHQFLAQQHIMLAVAAVIPTQLTLEALAG